jgi:hypothetical protein
LPTPDSVVQVDVHPSGKSAGPVLGKELLPPTADLEPRGGRHRPVVLWT